MNSIQKTARITGFLYLLLIPLGIFGIIYVPATLIVPGDIAATVSNIMANDMLFRLSIVSAFVAQFVNISWFSCCTSYSNQLTKARPR